MADKKVILVSPQQRHFDWNKCFICQKVSREKETCPASFEKTPQGKGRGYVAANEYLQIERSIKDLYQLNDLPSSINMTNLDEGNGVASTLIAHDAKYHRSCSQEIKPVRVKQAETRSNLKRKLEDDHCEDEIPDDDIQSDHEQRPATRSAPGSNLQNSQKICYFCGKGDGKLHDVTSFRLDKRVRRCANILVETEQVLIGKLSCGDLIAQEAKYHSACLVDLYRRADRHQLGSNCTEDEKQKHGLAFASVVSFIEESVEFADSQQNECVFKLSDLVKIYSNRLEEIQFQSSGRVHSTRLKERILSQFEDMRAFNKGREVYLTYDTAIGEYLKSATNINWDDDAYILAQAAKIIRRSMRDKSHDRFDGTFQEKCQEEFVSDPLFGLVSMILYGNSPNNQNTFRQQSALSLAQLIEFNTSLASQTNAVRHYHKVTQEPPLAVYLGMMIHSRTRSRTLIEKLYDVGLSISYDRVLQISTEMGNRVIKQFEMEKVVCPPNLKFGLFTTAAIDNIDVDPSSNTATSSFHGTALSLFQHEEPTNPGRKRPSASMLDTSSSKKLKALPKDYTDIKPAILNKTISIKQPAFLKTVPVKQCTLPDVNETIYYLDEKWLEYVQDCVVNEKEDKLDLSWGGFHASKTEKVNINPDVTALLPLFRESSKSAAMIKHALDVLWDAVNFLNEGQPNVVALDQPLYAIAKKIQWQWPEKYGIHKFVFMLGGLHTEMAYLSALGDWLDESGWVDSLSKASVATRGVAESFLSGSKVSKSRYAHEVTVCALDILMKKAYFQENATDDFDTWRKKKEDNCPQFKFWSTTRNMQLLLLRYVRSLRSGDFELYMKCLDEMLPCFFALDHGNYARWLPVHLQDMKSLHLSNPTIYQAFKAGHFVIAKTSRKFSSLPIDHAHEQNNKLVKGDGGAVGLTENAQQLTRWMISGPEIARIVQEFENNLPFNKGLKAETKHHEQTPSYQSRFRKHVTALISQMEELDNPFLETSDELIVLDTKDVVENLVCETIYKVESIGKEKYTQYMKERLINCDKPLDDTISRNKLPLFSYKPQLKSNHSSDVATLRNNVKLFSQLYIANQRRNGDIDIFFSHENTPVPPSLSKDGKLRSGDKSDLLECLENYGQPSHVMPAVEGCVIEGGVLVNVYRPTGQKYFIDYFQDVLLPHFQSQLAGVQRLDIVWDVYLENSLKSTAREHRGRGSRRKVGEKSLLPQKWDNFLRVSDNKTELFHYIASCIQSSMFPNAGIKQILTTYDDRVLSSFEDTALQGVSPCNHEEGDYRSVLHCFHMSNCGLKKLMLFTKDTDVVAIAISVFSKMMLEELWIKFGSGTHLRYIPIHEIVSTLGPERSRCLSLFHALTGCDQVSFFAKCGKKTAWKVWMNYPELTAALLDLCEQPSLDDLKRNMEVLERFVCLMYHSTSTKMEVNQCRRQLFIKHGRQLEGLPPTRDALQQHTLRAVYQGGFVWSQALFPMQILPNPELWGWKRDNSRFLPNWTTIPSVAKACKDLTKCTCDASKGCKGKCSCKKGCLPCTELCKCNGNCK